MQMQHVDEAETRCHDIRKEVQQSQWWMDDLEIIEALFLHTLASARSRHALDGYTSKLFATGKAIYEFRSDRARAKDYKFSRAERDGISVGQKLDEAGLTVL